MDPTQDPSIQALIAALTGGPNMNLQQQAAAATGAPPLDPSMMQGQNQMQQPGMQGMTPDMLAQLGAPVYGQPQPGAAPYMPVPGGMLGQ